MDSLFGAPPPKVVDANPAHPDSYQLVRALPACVGDIRISAPSMCRPHAGGEHTHQPADTRPHTCAMRKLTLAAFPGDRRHGRHRGRHR